MQISRICTLWKTPTSTLLHGLVWPDLQGERYLGLKICNMFLLYVESRLNNIFLSLSMAVTWNQCKQKGTYLGAGEGPLGDKERQEGQIWKKYNGRHEIKLHNKALCFANHICLAWGGGGMAMGATVVEHVHCRQDDMLTHSQKTGSVECSCLSHLSTYHFYL